MQQLMDPSRNMSRYRNLVNADNVQPPIIPFYPIVKKDLTFIHLGNHSEVEELINFEKLRMIAKEVSKKVRPIRISIRLHHAHSGVCMRLRHLRRVTAAH